MDEKKFESGLYAALVLAAAEEYDQVSAETPKLTASEERRQKKILADPFGYAAKRGRTKGQRIRHYALVAVLALAILVGTVFSIPQTRGIAIDLIREWCDDGSTTFSFNENVYDLYLSDVDITYIPEGYKLEFQDGFEGLCKNVCYINDSEERLSIDIFIAGRYFSVSIDNEHCDIYNVRLKNGIKAQMYEADETGWPSDLVWISKDGKLFFNVWGKLPPKELKKIANGIVVHAEKFYLPDVEIGYIPAGYNLLYEDSPEEKIHVFAYENDRKQPISIEVFLPNEYYGMHSNYRYIDPVFLKLDNGYNVTFNEDQNGELPAEISFDTHLGRVNYLIKGYLPKEELLKIANNMIVDGEPLSEYIGEDE